MKATRYTANLSSDGNDWRDRAKCRDLPAPVADALFFPTIGVAATTGKKFCRGANDLQPCPVRAQCLALGLREQFGVWGGVTEEERTRIRFEMDKPDHFPCGHVKVRGNTTRAESGELQCSACRRRAKQAAATRRRRQRAA